MNRRSIFIVVSVGFIALIAYGLFKSLAPVIQTFQGQVEAREVDVAAKISARVKGVFVKEGDSVSRGDLLFELDSPELTAKMAQAKAGRAAVSAISDKAKTGTREEEVRMARFAWARAKSAADLAQKTSQRFESLYEEGLISEQRHDEVITNADAAVDAQRAAKAQYDMAVNGARVEDRKAAQAIVRQAEGVVAEVLAFEEETHAKAPIGGQVAQVLVDVGELSPAGFPVITLVDLSDSWVVLNVLEHDLKHFKMNTTHTTTIPALGDREVQLSVYYIAPLADFATWHATRYSSGYDIKTFEVRMRPSKPIDGLRPGMSALIKI
jgi:HlyD family secretion protein